MEALASATQQFFSVKASIQFRLRWRSACLTLFPSCVQLHNQLQPFAPDFGPSQTPDSSAVAVVHSSMWQE